MRVTDTRSGKNKVNVNIPMGLVNVGIKMGARFAPQIEGKDMNLSLIHIYGRRQRQAALAQDSRRQSGDRQHRRGVLAAAGAVRFRLRGRPGLARGARRDQVSQFITIYSRQLHISNIEHKIFNLRIDISHTRMYYADIW